MVDEPPGPLSRAALAWSNNSSTGSVTLKILAYASYSADISPKLSVNVAMRPWVVSSASASWK